MVKILKFKNEHLEKLNVHGNFKEVIKTTNYSPMEKLEHCFSIIKGDKVLACTGVMFENEAFSLLDKNLKEDFIHVHKKSLELLDSVPYKKVMAKIDREFDEGVRWIKMLGFTFEKADGDNDVYVRSQNG